MFTKLPNRNMTGKLMNLKDQPESSFLHEYPENCFSCPHISFNFLRMFLRRVFVSSNTNWVNIAFKAYGVSHKRGL